MTTAADFWTLGDYSRIAELIAAMGPALVQAAGVGPGHRVLDVGAGTGNATLPAAATGAQVIGTDIAPELMAVGERAARARGLPVTWQVADAQALPFPDARVRRRAVGGRRHVRARPRGDRPRAAAGLQAGRHDRDGQLDARGRGGPVLRDPRPLRPARPGPGADVVGRSRHRHPPARARDRHHVALARPAGLRRAACRARRLLPRATSRRWWRWPPTRSWTPS